MALSAGPLDVPLGPLQALSTFLPNDASPLAAETESILKNLRTIQEQAGTRGSVKFNTVHQPCQLPKQSMAFMFLRVLSHTSS